VGDVIGVASKLPGVGDKFKGLADKVHGAADRVNDLRDSIREVPEEKTSRVRVITRWEDHGWVGIDAGADGDKVGHGGGLPISAFIDDEVARRAVKMTPQTDPFDVGAPAGPLGGAVTGSRDVDQFNDDSRRFGLNGATGPGQRYRPGDDGWHGQDRARDYSGPAAGMLRFARYMASRFGRSLLELIYTPLGFGIKSGRRVPLSFWSPAVNADHYDHVHVAMRKGGVVPGFGLGDRTRALLEPGEFVVRRPVVQALGPAFFHTLNHSDKAGSSGLTVSGRRADAEQRRVLRAALRAASDVGAGPQATKALLMAIMHESGARNLRYGHSTSTGPLQVLASTARSMGLNPRDTYAVAKAFLTRGYWGRGSAIALARREGIDTATIAHLVQGNATGTGVYARHSDEAAVAMRLLGRSSRSGSRRNGGASAPSGSTSRPTAPTGAEVLAGELAELDVAEQMATRTVTTADDDAARKGKRQAVGRRIRDVRRALKKRTLRPATRTRLNQELAGLLGQQRRAGPPEGRALRGPRGADRDGPPGRRLGAGRAHARPEGRRGRGPGDLRGAPAPVRRSARGERLAPHRGGRLQPEGRGRQPEVCGRRDQGRGREGLGRPHDAGRRRPDEGAAPDAGRHVRRPGRPDAPARRR